MKSFSHYYQRFHEVSDRLMGLMILFLHGLLMVGTVNKLSLIFFVLHFGLFILWQPMVQQSHQLNRKTLITLLTGGSLGVILFATIVNWWLVAFWIASLFALIGGRLLSESSPRERLPNLLAASYLLGVLLLWVVPKLLGATNDLAAAEFILTYFLPILPLIILFLSAKAQATTVTSNIDFFYTLLLFLFTSIIILGSFAIGVIWQVHYVQLLLFAVIGLAVTLVIISWLWNPSATFSGLELLMSRYLLSIGLPFEQWIRQIASHAHKTDRAEDFLNTAMQELADLNWVTGLSWQVDDKTKQMGETSEHISTFHFSKLALTLYSRWPFRPAMYLHVQLLTQLLGEFYDAKCREESITQTLYMQTLYETGARLTHDIKNILQSLGTLTAATQQVKSSADEERLLQLVQLQLPRLNQRLSNTLTKLEKPNVERKQQAKLSNWWESFEAINVHDSIIFEPPATFPVMEVDTDVLDSVVDNLIQNALQKAKRERDIVIKVTCLTKPFFSVEVSDTGSAMPDEVADQLFKSHIDSSQGLGVGLYHAGLQAEQAGYYLALIKNIDGDVRFRLSIAE